MKERRAKFKLYLHFINYHAMKTLPGVNRHVMMMYWRVEIELHVFLTSAVGGDKWLVSRPGHSSPAVRVAGIH
jgi:hypothetical protein